MTADTPTTASTAASWFTDPDRFLPPHTQMPAGGPFMPRSGAEACMRRDGRWPRSWDEPQADDPPAALPEQVNTAYELLLGGATEIEVRQELSKRYGAKTQPTRAYKSALKLIITEQRARSEHLPELVMAVRWKAIQGAMKQGSWSAAASMLRDAGAVAGEASADRLASAAPELTISIEPAPPVEAETP